MQTGESSFSNFRNFIGVVEDRNDPEQTGRLKVRVYSIHSDDTSVLPTDDLPWAMVVQPITSAGMSGIGRSPTGIVEGSWVYGVFLDEGEFQQPLVIGTIAGKPSQLPSGYGFSDHINEVYPLDDSSISNLNESSVSRLSRNNAESHVNLLSKRNNKETLGTIESAKASKVESVLADKDDAYYKRTTWKEPHPRFGGQGSDFPVGVPKSSYPLNHSWFTEAGHVFEVDDTPKAERIHIFHTSGTFQEIQPKGDRMTKVVGTDYEAVFGDKDIFVKGSVNITINGDARTLIKGNKIEEIDGDYMLTVRGDVVQKIAGNEAKEINSDQSIQINGNKSERVSKNVTLTTVGNFVDSIKGLFTKTVTGEESRTNLSKATHILPDNYTLLGANNLNIAAGGDLNIAAQGKMKLKSVGEQTVETDAAQIINVGSTQSITAAAHSTFNNNLTITGTTHSVGDVSTDAGNAPTLATHKHKQTGGTAPDGDGPNNKQTSVADEA
jgi:hypothetical protein